MYKIRYNKYRKSEMDSLISSIINKFIEITELNLKEYMIMIKYS